MTRERLPSLPAVGGGTTRGVLSTQRPPSVPLGHGGALDVSAPSFAGAADSKKQQQKTKTEL